MNNCKECVYSKLCDNYKEDNTDCFISKESIKKPCDVCNKSEQKKTNCAGCGKYKEWVKVYFPVLCSVYNGKLLKKRGNNNEIR